MSFEVTLHPFDEREYIDLVLAVVVGRRPAEDLLTRYGTDTESVRLISAWAPQMQDALRFLRGGDGEPWSTVVNFAAAAMNAHVHPAYYLGDLGVSYWHAPGEAPFRAYTKSMAIPAANVPEIGVAVCEIREGFCGTYSAGSYVAPGEVAVLARDIEHRGRDFARYLESGGYDPAVALAPVLEAMYYARERRLAVLEVTHCVVPHKQQSLFPQANLRAAYLQNLNPEITRRVRTALAR